MTKFVYYSLSAIAAVKAIEDNQVNGYIEDNIDTDAASNSPVYYNDATSEYRVPDWMKNAYNGDLVENNLQRDGSWNKAHSAISLGNGHLTGENFHGNQQGTSTQKQVDFLNAVKSYYVNKGTTQTVNGRSVSGVETPYDAQIDGQAASAGNDSWDHVKNWWYRDGQLFALILDDRANEMMHGDFSSQTFKDVTINSNDNVANDEDNTYLVTSNVHHMEHLRQFCNRMGGDLWAPSSQEEYDDLMEREGGVCDAHGETVRQGTTVNTEKGKVNFGSTEVYLNIHREEYAECPDAPFVRNPKPFQHNEKFGDPSTRTQSTYDCNGKYDANNAANADDQRIADTDKDVTELYTFYTTDPFFSSRLDTGMCGTPQTRREFEYAVFKINENQACTDEGEEDVPYISENCFDAAESKHRYQKFVQQDRKSINDYLKSADGKHQRQKECVVATCNQQTVDDGPDGDKRKQSEWNMIGCNQHSHTGICRIRAFGCDAHTYACKDNYSRSCGTRSYYSKSINKYVSSNAEAALDAVVTEMEANVNINNKDAKKEAVQIADVPSLRSNSQVNVVVTTEDVATVEAWRDTIAEIPNGDAVEEKQNGVTYPECTCECHNDDWAGFSATVQLVQQDATRSLTLAGPNAAKSDALGTTAAWSCADPNNCYTGGVTAQCKMTETYEAGWRLDTAVDANTCTNQCCNDDVAPKFNLANPINLAADFKWWAQKPGAQIEVQCVGNNHIGNDVNNKQATLTAGADLDNCWTDPGCSPAECGCPEKENGYCYVKDNPTKSDFDNGDQVICRCNEEMVNVGADQDLPFDTRTCNDGAWTAITSKCEPLFCANPPDILDGTTIIAIPTGSAWKANVGERITYQCAEGFENAQDEAPFAECCRKDEAELRNTDDAGQLGFFCPPVGTCRRVTKTCPAIEEAEANAWMPVYIEGSVGLADQCHNNDVYGVATGAAITFAQTGPFQEGTKAVFECYDDFTAYMRDDFLLRTHDVNEDINCANGNKAANAECRTDETAERYAKRATDNTYAVALNNGKVIRRCVDGEWLVASHECVCAEEAEFRSQAVDYFDFSKVCMRETVRKEIAAVNTKSGDGDNGDSSAFTPSVVLTTCGLLPAFFYN